MKKQVVLSAFAASLMAFAFTGCMGNPYQLTPEQQAQAIQNQQEAMAKMQKMFGNKFPNLNNQNVQAEEKAAPIVQVPTIMQDELKAKIDSFGVASSVVNIERVKNSITIDSKPLSDYEGSVKQVGFNSVTGYVTYLVETSPNNYNMKFFQATSKQEPLTVATVKFQDGTWQIASVTGKKLSGDTLILGSSGFALSRIDGSGFTYEHTVGVKSIDIPQGYQLAKSQNGDVLGTKTVLLEIPEVNKEEEGGFASAMSNLKSLGAYVGIGKKQDYAFLNLENGSLSKINISSEGKTSTQCIEYDSKNYNKYVKKCLKYADPVESLYRVKDGSRNTKHYYWLITWLNSKSGPIGITQEDGLSNIYAVNLNSGKKVLLANRTLGFTSFDVFVQKDGKIKLTANNGPFVTETVEDVEAKIESSPAVLEEKEVK
jgi:hypothetical protein